MTSYKSHFTPAKPTEVLEEYWRYAKVRQDIYFKKLDGASPPWTSDPIIRDHRFTNTYRAADRVSQYLIKEVIYSGIQSNKEIFFRTILFKLFNKISTWELLLDKLGSVTYETYRFEKYDDTLTRAMLAGDRIYNAAYIMPSGSKRFKVRKKHQALLHVLELMMDDEVYDRLADEPTMQGAYELLRSYPLLGEFLAFQFIIDLNYSNMINFSEMDFVVAGPGAKNGIRKCFSNLGGYSTADIIRMVTETQEIAFQQLGLNFQDLWGRKLQLIDCQNIFCEIDKYSRVRFPNLSGITGRSKIKQKYESSTSERIPTPWFPPKWGLNDKIRPSKSSPHQLHQMELRLESKN